MPDYEENFDDIFQPRLTRADVQAEVQKSLANIAQYQAQVTGGVEHAIAEISQQYPDFKEKMPAMRRVVAEELVLQDAISAAENNPNLQSYLKPLYGIAYRLSQSAQPGSEPAQSEQPESPRPSGLTEETIFQGTEASKRVSLTPQNRKNLISSLEEKGILDVEF